MKRGRTRWTLVVLLLAAGIAIGATTPAAQAADGSSRASSVEVTALPFQSEVVSSTDMTRQVSPSCATETRSGAGARWFRLDPSVDTRLLVEVHDSEFRPSDNSTAVLLHAGPGGDQELGCARLLYSQPYGRIRAALRAGETYFVVLSSYIYFDDEWEAEAVKMAGWRLLLEQETVPANDLRSAATPISTLPFTSPRMNLAQATVEGGEVLPSCAGRPTGTVWFRVQVGARQAVKVDWSLPGSAMALRNEQGDEIDCRQGTEQMRFRVPTRGTYFLQIAGADMAAITVAATAPAPNDDLAGAPFLRSPDLFTGSVFPVRDSQDGAVATLEAGEPFSPGVIGSLWWIYFPDHHTYISVKNATCCPDVEIRVFETVNGVLLNEVQLDRGLTDDGAVRWLAAGGTRYAIQFGMRTLRPVTLFASLNPATMAHGCVYDTCFS